MMGGVVVLSVVVVVVVNPNWREFRENPEYPGGRMFPSEMTVMVAVSVLLPTLFSAAQVYSPASYVSMSWILRCWPVLDTDTRELGLTMRLLFHQVTAG